MAHAPGIGPEACANAQLNVVWGNNATVTNVHLVRQIRLAKRKGGRLAVIDPLRTKIAEQADLHLAIKPGTDVLLGFALAVELERFGAHDRAFIAEHVHGYDEYMTLARPWSADVAARCLRDTARRYSAACSLDGGGRSAGHGTWKRA